jgi:hypothetical protein
MSAGIKRIALDKLVPHPGNPNRISRTNFGKLVRNIERTGRYEPLVVRPCAGRRGFFQIINGHHRCEALRHLGHKTAEVVVWNVDDEQTDILLATLNRLGGRDTLDKKLALLQRLSVTMALRKLAQWLPQTSGQLERLVHARAPGRAPQPKWPAFAIPMVFLVEQTQERQIEEAIARASAGLPDGQTRAARRAAALMCIARCFLGQDGPAAIANDVTAEPASTTTP